MNAKTEKQIENLKNQTIGVEIEMNHITRERAAKLAADFFGTGRYENTARRNGYCTWSAWDAQGREWRFQRDVSISGTDSEKCELVTPILKFNLDKAGYETATALSAEDALMRGIIGYDLVLLDVMMEGISGFQMAQMMKKNPESAKIPIIFITAKDTEEDTLKGFDLGADDYIAKPFSVREVVSRVNAVLRRVSSASSDPARLSYKTLTLDMNGKKALVDGNDTELTKTEFEILRILVSDIGHVFTRDEILGKVWPDDVVVLGRTVDVNITRLRKKLGKYGNNISTRHGYGYCFEDKQLQS